MANPPKIPKPRQKPKPFKCSICEKLFDTLQQLQDHATEEHGQ